MPLTMPLRSTGITLFHHYYGRLPLPFNSHFLLFRNIGSSAILTIFLEGSTVPHNLAFHIALGATFGPPAILRPTVGGHRIELDPQLFYCVTRWQ